MLAIASAILLSLLSFRRRNRVSLELEIVALRYQLTVLRRQRPGRPCTLPGDRPLCAWLHRLWPSCLNAMVLVKPTTVVQWHHVGFRRYWRWRSRSHGRGRPAVAYEVRDLIREMSQANPFWGAPRIHGELLRLGISVGQTAVAKYMARRAGSPSPTWRSFLRNHMDGIAALDMYVVATATFRLLYVMVLLHHARSKDPSL